MRVSACTFTETEMFYMPVYKIADPDYNFRCQLVSEAGRRQLSFHQLSLIADRTARWSAISIIMLSVCLSAPLFVRPSVCDAVQCG